MKARYRIFIALMVALLALILPIAGQESTSKHNIQRLPDSSTIRKNLREEWLQAPIDIVKEKQPAILKNEQGLTFEVHWEEKDDRLAIIIIPETTLDIKAYVGDKVVMEKTKTYIIGTPGSWVLFRDIKTGRPISMRYYYWQDSEVYIELMPWKLSRAVANLVVFNSYMAKAVQLGIPFERLYYISYEELKERTQKLLPWKKVSVYPGMYHASLQMAGVIESNLKNIVLSDDAAYDENNNPIFIRTGDPRIEAGVLNDTLVLSGAGLLKWIADGLAIPITNSGLNIAKLSLPTVEYDERGLRGVLSQDHNISFALDWARNIATELVNIRYNRAYTSKEAGTDVDKNYFVSRINENSVVSDIGYIKDTGYEMVDLKAILYTLAVQEPSTCYLGAIKEPSSKELYIFRKNVVFFPYFDDKLKFDCKVFLGNKETTLKDFMEDYSDCYIHLSRVKCSDIFFPYTKSN